MYCVKCGNENPSGARFCVNCGTDLCPSADVQKSSGRTSGGTSGGMKKILISAVVFVMVFVFSFAVANGGGSGLQDVQPSGSTPSNAYSNIFRIYGPGTPKSDFTGQNLKTASYVIHYGDNMLENHEYVYEDGIILAWVDTIYVPVSGLDSSQKTELNNMMLSELKTYTNLSFSKLSSYEENGYYVYKMIFSDLNKKENVQQLIRVGLLEGDSSANHIGIKDIEEGWLASGYTKR